MKNTNIIRKAQRFAYERHAGQFRSDGIPFVTHPAKVAQIISQVTTDENLIASAWLHDMLEDTATTFDELVKEFNLEVAELVHEVTKDKSHPDSEFPRLKTQKGITLKFADRLSNVSDMEGWPQERKQDYLDDSRFW